MAIPDEYKLEGVTHKADNLVVHQATHPIHGDVSIYMVDDALPTGIAVTVKRRLYQNGIQMRNFSESQLPFVTRTLEVSQNPNEPYIITEYTKYNLEDLVNNGTKLKPKRTFQIFSQILQAIISLKGEGWQAENVRTHQIRLTNIYEGKATFTALEDTGLKTKITTTTSVKKSQTEAPTLEIKKGPTSTPEEEIKTLEHNAASEVPRPAVTSTVTLSQSKSPEHTAEELRFIQRNIYILGEVAYQLVFGKKYQLSDNTAAVNLQKLSLRWRKVVNKALSPNLEERYETYETVLSDINKAISRNKKIALWATPVFIVLLGLGALFGYNQYNRHKIMTSEAGQAIENFLNIVNTTDSEFPPPLEPPPKTAESDDDTILEPFEKVETLGEEN